MLWQEHCVWREGHSGNGKQTVSALTAEGCCKADNAWIGHKRVRCQQWRMLGAGGASDAAAVAYAVEGLTAQREEQQVLAAARGPDAMQQGTTSIRPAASSGCRFGSSPRRCSPGLTRSACPSSRGLTQQYAAGGGRVSKRAARRLQETVPLLPVTTRAPPPEGVQVEVCPFTFAISALQVPCGTGSNSCAVRSNCCMAG